MEFFEGIWFHVILFLILITVLVFVHEMGHYLVARWNGVRVEVFSIGFGPEVVGWTDRHQTRWKISLIPLGGYVKMFGEMLVPEKEPGAETSSMSPAERAVAFNTKRLGQRSAVVVAGPIANFLFAVVVFALLFSTFGQSYTVPKVTSVMPESAAERAGLRPGDVFKVIDGMAIDRFEDVQRIVGLRPNVPLEIVVLRDGREVTLTATPVLKELKDSRGKIVQRVGLLGVHGSARESVRHDPVTAVWRAGKETVDLTFATLTAVGQMIAGTRPADEIGGPLRIAKFTGDVAQRNLPDLIWFMAYISINLGLINLFPIPMLDGGHLLFYMAEMVRGRPLGARAQEYGFRLGWVLVLTLIVFVMWNDIVYLGWINF
ncbi:MAG: RIP metalloprotease RseP [Kiloniellales bacterium]